jgi:uncharacterized membrane protein YphA (DoxX/SURF4 family)
MLNVFPELLVYQLLAPTLLRMAVVLVFAYLAYRHFEHREDISKTRFPVVGQGMWIVWLTIIIEVATAAALFFGYYTQVAAILGAIGAIKHIVWRGKFPNFFWLTRSAAFLLLVICLSLLLTGAGAFAFDLPL